MSSLDSHQFRFAGCGSTSLEGTFASLHALLKAVVPQELEEVHHLQAYVPHNLAYSVHPNNGIYTPGLVHSLGTTESLDSGIQMENAMET